MTVLDDMELLGSRKVARLLGISDRSVRQAARHHSWDFTAGTYVHLEDEDLPDGAIVGDF